MNDHCSESVSVVLSVGGASVEKHTHLSHKMCVFV
jgi:hypothetical protein